MGAVLAIVALVFVGRRLVEHWPVLVEFVRSPRASIALGIAAIGYGASNLLLSSAWFRLITWCGANGLDARAARSIFARSQLAKYVPGNIFHLAGRQLLGRRAGIGHRPLAASSFLEVWGLVTAALGIAVAGIRLAPDLESVLDAHLTLALLFGLLALGLAVPWGLRSWPRLRRRLGSFSDRLAPSEQIDRFDLLADAQLDRSSRLYLIVLRYGSFFLASGQLLSVLVFAFNPSAAPDQSFRVLALAAVAWIGGYLTPGAPAGLGVREAILVTALTPMLGAGEAVTIAVAFRTATVLGDLLFWAFVPRYRTDNGPDGDPTQAPFHPSNE